MAVIAMMVYIPRFDVQSVVDHVVIDWGKRYPLHSVVAVVAEEDG
jgi:hypothetical protein